MLQYTYFALNNELVIKIYLLCVCLGLLLKLEHDFIKLVDFTNLNFRVLSNITVLFVTTL